MIAPPQPGNAPRNDATGIWRRRDWRKNPPMSKSKISSARKNAKSVAKTNTETCT